MVPWNPGRPVNASQIDYRPSRCRCGATILPHHAVCPRCQRRQNLFFSGLDRLYEDDLDGLVVYHQQEVAAHPDDYIRLHHLAGAHLLRGEYEIARDLYRKTIDMNPNFPEAHLNLGGVLAYLGDDDGAVEALREYIRLDLHSPRIERVLRVICAIKNIPYEDALQETGIKDLDKVPGLQSKPLPKPGSLSDRIRLRKTRHAPLNDPLKKWQITPIDFFLLLLIIIALAGYFLFPAQSKSLVASAATGLESRYAFTVAGGNDPAASEDESAIAEDDPAAGVDNGEEDEPPGILNADPQTDSYFPLAQDNRWDYLMYDSRDPDGLGPRQDQTSGEMIVTGYANRELGVWAVRNGENTIYYVDKPNGLYSVRNPSRPWSTMILQIPYPPDVGKSSRDGGQTVTVEAIETVQTSMGLFECVKLHYTSPDPGLEWFAWFGRDVGLVKYVGAGLDGTYHVRELRDYELN